MESLSSTAPGHDQTNRLLAMGINPDIKSTYKTPSRFRYNTLPSSKIGINNNTKAKLLKIESNDAKNYTYSNTTNGLIHRIKPGNKILYEDFSTATSDFETTLTIPPWHLGKKVIAIGKKKGGGRTKKSKAQDENRVIEI